MKQENNRLISLVLLVVLVIGTIFFVYAKSNSESPLPTEKSDSTFELTDLEGNSVNLQELLAANDLVILNFWATWCPPCRGEIPDLIKFTTEYAQRRVKLVGISSEMSSTVQAFAKQQAFNYQLLIDVSGAMSQNYRIEAIPTTFILDRQGTILYRKVGSISYDTLAKEVEKLLSQL